MGYEYVSRDGRYTLVKPGLGLDLLDLVDWVAKVNPGGAPLVSAGEFRVDPTSCRPMANGLHLVFLLRVPANCASLRSSAADPDARLPSRQNEGSAARLVW